MFIPPRVPNKYYSSWAQYSILIPKGIRREKLMHKLNQNGIPSMVYYKIPVHLQKGYEKYGYQIGDFNITENVSRRILSLPMHPYLDKNTQDIVLDELNDIS
jgi:dTDP-4-amino-4,6-dideoxygalactose transaminase